MARRTEYPSETDRSGWSSAVRSSLAIALIVATLGCSGEPSERELKNRRELEALLTAISLKDRTQLDKDAVRIDERHASGALSDGPYKILREIVATAKAGKWSDAEKRAYEFRESTPFFD